MSLRALGFAFTLSVIAAWPAAAQSDEGSFAPVEGGRVWYQTCGSGPRAMVLIHDGVLHSATWDEVWPILCKDFHVVRYDRRGFGRSPAASQPYSPVDDLWAVMRAARMEHGTIVGSSAGGELAVDFTLQHPKAVDRLIIAGAQVSGFAQSQYFEERTVAVLQRLKKGDLGALSSVFAPGHDAARAKAMALLKSNPQDLGWLNHPDPARPAPEARPLLPTIKAPTLILVADHDGPDVQAWAGAAEVLIPGARRVVVADVGHLMYLEHPDVFAGLVKEFAIAENRRTASPGTEAALRRHIESLETGRPNFGELAPLFAEEVRLELPNVLDRIKSLGALKSIAFHSVGPTGMDLYVVTFEHGKTEWGVPPLTAGGKVRDMSFRRL